MTEFTAEDQAALAALQLKQADAAWADAEALRVAQLAAITPVATALGSPTSINATVASLKAARSTLDVDTAIRLDRVVQALSVDAISILNTAQKLSTAAPKPSDSATTTG